jgi:ATP-dependent Clp protease ATP-binding subunit ClpA
MSETPRNVPNVPGGQPFSRDLRAVVVQSITEAQRRNSALVEAEHLLLALSRQGSAPIRDALAAAGLDPAGVERSLDAERDASLRTAGVTLPPPERLAASPRVDRPRWGASFKEALTRAHRLATGNRHARMSEVDVLAGIFALELGTVPRAMALAAVDRRAVLERARRAA